MHPAIAQLPSAFFYAGRLRTAAALCADPTRYRPAPPGFPWPRGPGYPVAFVSTDGGGGGGGGGGGDGACWE
eukprot:SAG22_NODE_1278_length_4905_cov_1.660216_4_plen_71_part_01